MSYSANRHRGIAGATYRVTLAGSAALLFLVGATPVRASAVNLPKPAAQTTTALTYYATTSEHRAPSVDTSDQVVLVATVTPITGTGPAPGTVAFFDGSTALGTTPLHSRLAASYAILVSAPMSLGAHTVTAQYSGEATFNPSSAAIQIAVVAHDGPAMNGVFIQGGLTAISAHGVGPAATGELDLVGLFHATVTCLQVSGRDGIATTVVDSSQDSRFPVGEIIVAEGVDNGNPSQTSSPDLWRNSFENNGGIHQVSARCWMPFFPPVAIQSGNIIVVDGS
jgi:hypothetical protein